MMVAPATYTLTGAPHAVVIGAEGIDEILQNVRLILRTLTHDVVLDRKFAWAGEMLDRPSPYEAQQQFHRIAAAIETYEPRVAVLRVSLVEATNEGRLVPKVEFRVKDGAL